MKYEYKYAIPVSYFSQVLFAKHVKCLSPRSLKYILLCVQLQSGENYKDKIIRMTQEHV